MNVPEESLMHFKLYITKLFSVNIADPNVGVSFADDAINAVMAYSGGRKTWPEFVERCEALLAEASGS